MSEFHKLRKPMGSDQQQLSDAKMPSYYMFKKKVFQKKKVMGRNISEQNS
jgi:hypothetical protein